jgi:carbamoyltransferase
VLRERVSEWFDLETDSPYMLLVAPVSKSRQVAVPAAAAECRGLERLNVLRSTIPAVTHVDHSARVQTVRREDNPLYYDIIEAFDRLTGCPVVVNTSFNLRGEPIVCTPEDAYRCFMRSDIDVLVLESYVLEKGDQPELVEGEQWRVQLTAD